nr:alanyl-tRNA editing protein [Lachnospiraceae bacterium]
MTRKLFYEDIHMTTFQATVISCDVIGASEKTEENKEPLYRLLLDSTAFFPEEGGQSADIGTINGQDVLDVQIEKDLIYHTVKEPVAVGEIIEGQVNWKQRFDFMQQHSGEHILSGIVHERFGYNNVGFHLSTREVTLDFDGALDSEQLKDIELAANRVIWLNLPIEISYPENSELAALSYRSKIEIDGRVRIVTIPGVDVCACCAPHTET